MMTVLMILGIVVGLVALPILINLDWGGSVWNTFDFDLTQSEKANPWNK
jgi:hypothetical protein